MVGHRYISAASILIATTVLAFASMSYQGQVYMEPVLLNTDLKVIYSDTSGNGRAGLAYWNVEQSLGPGDSAYLRRDVVDRQRCLGIHLFQDGMNDQYVWAMVRVRQEVKTDKLTRLFNSRVQLSVYPTFPYVYDKTTKTPDTAFGLEISDGQHLLWMIFSDQKPDVFMIDNHRIKVIEAKLNTWSTFEIDIAKEYHEAGWDMPKVVYFALITGASRAMKGEFAGFFAQITLLESSRS